MPTPAYVEKTVQGLMLHESNVYAKVQHWDKMLNSRPTANND
jgi:hypothetical protein